MFLRVALLECPQGPSMGCMGCPLWGRGVGLSRYTTALWQTRTVLLAGRSTKSQQRPVRSECRASFDRDYIFRRPSVSQECATLTGRLVCATAPTRSRNAGGQQARVTRQGSAPSHSSQESPTNGPVVHSRRDGAQITCACAGCGDAGGCRGGHPQNITPAPGVARLCSDCARSPQTGRGWW